MTASVPLCSEIDTIQPPVWVDGLPVTPFEDAKALLTAVLALAHRPGQWLVGYVNVHVANQAQVFPVLASFLQATQFNYCDGAGIVLGAKLLGGGLTTRLTNRLTTRLTGADFLLPFLAEAANRQLTVYLLGGKPGVSDAFLESLNQTLPKHTVVGHHHGFLANNAPLNRAVLTHINQLQPDILIVGMGSPLQEQWVMENRAQLAVKVIWPLGAVMDYFTGQQRRCPAWLGNLGLEWAYRLASDPLRLAERYVIGNPWFLGRVFWQAIVQRVAPLARAYTASHIPGYTRSGI